MGSPVGTEVGAVVEIFATLCTLVGFLPGVDSDGLKGLRPYWSFPHTSHLCGFSPLGTAKRSVKAEQALEALPNLNAFYTV